MENETPLTAFDAECQAAQILVLKKRIIDLQDEVKALRTIILTRKVEMPKTPPPFNPPRKYDA